MEGAFFLKTLNNVIRKDAPLPDKIAALATLLVDICRASVKKTNIQFYTAFSVIAYTGHQYNIPGRLIYNVHSFRRKSSSIDDTQDLDDPTLKNMYDLGIQVIADLIRIIYDVVLPPSILVALPGDQVYDAAGSKKYKFEKYLRVLIVAKDTETDALVAIDHNRPEQKISVKYNLPDRNELFSRTVDALGSVVELPVEVNLVDVEIDDEGCLLPRAFVIQPDYLLDITAVAHCFSGRSPSSTGFVSRRFMPVESSKYLMLGHIANFFLDELMSDYQQSFQDLIRRVFQINPLAFALFDDSTAKEIVQKAQRHYMSLKIVIGQSFKKQGIDPQYCFLEPTFYSEKYGLQGRLDVLFDDPQVLDDAAIVELKSGKPFNANAYGLSHSHYIQTLLYDLLIKSASADKLKPTNYILYSGQETDHLRFAPAVRSQQYEALAMRNELICLDQRLARADQILDQPDRFSLFLKHEAQSLSGFDRRDMNELVERFEQLSDLEKKYFLSMVSMVVREHRLSKMGVEGGQRGYGQASLWRHTLAKKEDQYEVLSNLQIEENNTSHEEPIIRFRRTEKTNALANFRVGDLALLYPYRSGNDPLGTQLFKGTLIELDAVTVTVRLRARQFNDELFKKYQYWNLEHDVLDSSFNALYRSLYVWTSHPPHHREKFLTVVPPSEGKEASWNSVDECTEHQNEILKKILGAQDYFLLWGPPGTGKTSIIIKHLMRHLLEHTDEQVILLAYTNRAVDELCMSLQAAGATDFLRVGSRFSTNATFHKHLLSVQARGVSQRSQLIEIIQNKRVIVGTLSSILGKSELFKIKKFDRLIIDEATQVLEPMLASLMPSVDKVLLIGDHRQLAAVVSQPSSQRKVQNDALRDIGLTDLGDSLFERLYRRCVQMKWTWAYDTLNQQGRMHQDIMAFPSKHFYDGELAILPTQNGGQAQVEALHWDVEPQSIKHKSLLDQRVIFYAVSSGELFNSKVNQAEATKVADIVKDLTEIYTHNNYEMTSDDIGIITPFRAQIAQINLALKQWDLAANNVSIDTVERYQGSARNTIIISLCVNSINQLTNLVSLSSDEVDRKLNVALTRAKNQLIVVGDPEILGENETYRAFIKQYSVRIPT